MSSFYITSYSQITPGLVRINGDAIFRHAERDPSLFLKAAYRGLGFSYPKFFKMDNLCKLAFLAAEPLLADGRIKGAYVAKDTGIILQNSSSSLTSDEKHQQSISSRENYFPSPSVFVYTLPNIMAGEIAIRHGIKGENAVQVTPEPDPLLLYHTISELFTNKRIDCCLAGWIEEYHETLSACLVVVERSPQLISSGAKGESIIFDPSTIERLFKDVL
jgi:hypothetical protein